MPDRSGRKARLPEPFERNQPDWPGRWGGVFLAVALSLIVVGLLSGAPQ